MSKDIAKAIHAALSANASVQDSLGQPPRLYDAVPEDPIFPYLTYGALRSEDLGGDGVHLMSHQMTLHIWSRYSGRAETLHVIEAVKAVIEDKDALSSYLVETALVSATTLYTDILRAPDGRTHHGLLRLSLLTEIPQAESLGDAA